jgi:hypothetical protein
VLDAVGNKGQVSVIFLISKRQDLAKITQIVEKTNPQAIFTVEGVKSVSDVSQIAPGKQPIIFSFLPCILRK